MYNPDLLGTLIVVVLKAKNLPDKHTFSKQDPYTEVSLGSGKPQRTKIDPKGGQHPLWDEEFRLEVLKETSGNNRKLSIRCFAQEPRMDELIGETTLDIDETLQKGEFDDWVQLSNAGSQRGEVYLEMTFYAAGPAPLNRRATKMKPSERMSRSGGGGGGGEVGLPAFNGPPPETGANTAPLAPHKPSPHGSKHSSPLAANSSLPTLPPQDGIIPPLLRPGNPHSPPKFVQETKPLPPNDPLHVRKSDPQRVASPPVSASAYPPASAPNPVFSSPPLPSSLLPARPSPGAYGAPSTSPTPTHARTGSYGSQGRSTPFPTPMHQRTGSQGSNPPNGFAGGFGFPTAQLPVTGPSDYSVQSSYNNGYNAPAPSFPGASTSPYGAPAPHIPGEWPSDRSSGYNAYTPPEPSLPDPFAPRQATLNVDNHHGYQHPIMNIPPTSRSPLGFRMDEGELPTPKADFQPRHSPAVPTSHLRHDSTGISPPHPDAGRYDEYSSYRNQQSLGYGGGIRDAEAALAFERQERDRAHRLSEQEERDLEMARKLDYELNATGP